MNEMSTNNRDYDNRYYDEAMHGNRESYRDNYRYDNRGDYRESYRDDYREDYRNRDYDRRGGKINNRNYYNYREQDYYEETEMIMEDIRKQYRKLEDLAEMAHNPQDKNMIMKIAQREKENYHYMKQIVEK